MASRLVNLRYTMSWRDFNPVEFPVPEPGQKVDTAQTAANGVPSGIMLDSAGSGQCKIRDSIVVTIVLDKSQCWVAKWIFTQKDKAYRDNLLKHEQGHYDITALVGRDLFNALVALRSNTYSSSADAKSDMDAQVQKFGGMAQPISDRYDTDTANGTDAAQQAAWNGYISTAFASNDTFQNVLAQANITF